jgi:hypothetical protein
MADAGTRGGGCQARGAWAFSTQRVGGGQAAAAVDRDGLGQQRAGAQAANDRERGDANKAWRGRTGHEVAPEEGVFPAQTSCHAWQASRLTSGVGCEASDPVELTIDVRR